LKHGVYISSMTMYFVAYHHRCESLFRSVTLISLSFIISFPRVCVSDSDLQFITCIISSLQQNGTMCSLRKKIEQRLCTVNVTA